MRSTGVGVRASPRGMTTVASVLGMLKLCNRSLCSSALAFLLQCDLATANETPAVGQRAPAAFPNAILCDMWWVVVDSPANPPDRNGYGTVRSSFLIGRYEVTNDEYCRFLNGCRTGRSNTHGVSDGPTRPDELRTPADWDRGVLRSQAADGTFSYTAAPQMGDKPVVNLRWCDVARMANWLHNGADEEADTEHGAYQLGNEAIADGAALAPLPAARVWVPSLDEWYKAAFHSRESEAHDRYWRYPTRSNQRPRPVRADSYGIGRVTDKTDGNSANFSTQSRWPAVPPLPAMIARARWIDSGAVTSVGSNGRGGSYGTYDMAGNAPEVITVLGSHPPRVMAGVVGGGIAESGASDCISADSAAIHHAGRGGFRLACVVSELIPIKGPKKYEPLEQIEASLRGVLTCLDDVIERPPDHVTKAWLNGVRTRLRRVEVRTSANGAGDSLRAITRDAGRLLDAIGKDVLTRDAGIERVAAAARVASALLAVEDVRTMAEADRLEICSEFERDFLSHQEKAQDLHDAARCLLPENAQATP